MEKRLIDTPNYKGTERRNGRLTLAFRDWLTIVSITVSLLVGGAVAWTKLNGKVEAHDEKIKKVEKTPLKIVGIEKDIKYLKESFDEFKTEQKQVNGKVDNKLDIILREVIKNNTR